MLGALCCAAWLALPIAAPLRQTAVLPRAAALHMLHMPFRKEEEQQHRISWRSKKQAVQRRRQWYRAQEQLLPLLPEFMALRDRSEQSVQAQPWRPLAELSRSHQQWVASYRLSRASSVQWEPMAAFLEAHDGWVASYRLSRGAVVSSAAPVHRRLGGLPLGRVPDAAAVLIVALHAVAFPAATVGVSLMAPVVEVRENNWRTVSEVGHLVANMYYGGEDQLLAWHEMVEALPQEELGEAVRSDVRMQRLVDRMLRELRDPYSAYASQDKLAATDESSPFGLQLALSPKSPVAKALSQQPAAASPADQLTVAGGAASGAPTAVASAEAEVAVASAGAEGGLTVTSIVAGSAAEHAGIRVGDAVRRIQGHPSSLEVPAAELTQADVRDLIAGRRLAEWIQGLSLQVQSDGSEPRTVVLWPHLPPPLISSRLLRTSHARPSRPSERESSIGYVRVAGFSESVTSELVRVIGAWEAQQQCVGYVVDLRNNPGGQVREALIDAALLLHQPDMVVAYTLDAAGQVTTHTAGAILDDHAATLPALETATADCDAPAVDCPVAATTALTMASVASTTNGPAAGAAATKDSDVLAAPSPASRVAARGSSDHRRPPLVGGKPLVLVVDRGTASSAELFAAALHDNGAGIIVGEGTYGKALVQRVFPLPNGAALKLTIGEYFRPSMERIVRGNGIEPDFNCVASPTAAADDICIEQATGLVLSAARSK